MAVRRVAVDAPGVHRVRDRAEGDRAPDATDPRVRAMHKAVPVPPRAPDNAAGDRAAHAASSPGRETRGGSRPAARPSRPTGSGERRPARAVNQCGRRVADAPAPRAAERRRRRASAPAAGGPRAPGPPQRRRRRTLAGRPRSSGRGARITSSLTRQPSSQACAAGPKRRKGATPRCAPLALVGLRRLSVTGFIGSMALPLDRTKVRFAAAAVGGRLDAVPALRRRITTVVLADARAPAPGGSSRSPHDRRRVARLERGERREPAPRARGVIAPLCD